VALRGTLSRPLALLLLSATVSLSGTGCSQAPPTAVSPRPGSLFVVGYHPYWAGDAWMSYPVEQLQQIFFFEVELDSDGGLADLHGWHAEWPGLQGEMARQGVQVIPTVTLYGDGAFEALFSDPEATGRAVESLLGLLRDSPTVRGLHLDVEVFQPVSRKARDGYTAFTAQLGAAMRRVDPGLGLSVFTLAFDDADAYNERALAASADYLVVQGYDLHNRTDAVAGPVAALKGWGRLNWVSILERYDSLGIPRSRLVMGIPLYGYEWPTVGAEPGAPTRGEGRVTPLEAPESVLPEAPRAWRQAETHGAARDPESGSPYYAFQDADGGWVQGWFEDRESLRAKLDFVRSRGLAGVAFFPMAYGASAIWNDLETVRAPLQR
jgi:spore germination protein